MADMVEGRKGKFQEIKAEMTLIINPNPSNIKAASDGDPSNCVISVLTTMFLPQFFLEIPRNPLTAVGIPLALGIFSGSGTARVVRSPWYQVSPGNACPDCTDIISELESPSRQTAASGVPYCLANSLPMCVKVP